VPLQSQYICLEHGMYCFTQMEKRARVMHYLFTYTHMIICFLSDNLTNTNSFIDKQITILNNFSSCGHLYIIEVFNYIIKAFFASFDLFFGNLRWLQVSVIMR
jgi:hypothetical protein